MRSLFDALDFLLFEFRICAFWGIINKDWRGGESLYETGGKFENSTHGWDGKDISDLNLKTGGRSIVVVYGVFRQSEYLFSQNWA